MKIYSNDELKRDYLSNQDECWRLLIALRNGTNIPERERQALWLLLSQNVSIATYKHYRIRARGVRFNTYDGVNWHYFPKGKHRRVYDIHTSRILYLAHFIKTYGTTKETTKLPRGTRYQGVRTDMELVRKAMVAYHMRFAYLETIRLYQDRGIALTTNLQSRPARLMALVDYPKWFEGTDDIEVALNNWYNFRVKQHGNMLKRIEARKALGQALNRGDYDIVQDYRHRIPDEMDKQYMRTKFKEYLDLKQEYETTVVSWDAFQEGTGK